MPKQHPDDPFRTNSTAREQKAMLPRRRSIKAEDIDLEPPDIEDLLAAAWAKHRPRLTAGWAWVRQSKTLLMAVAVLICSAVVLSGVHHRRAQEIAGEARRTETLRLAERALKDVRSVMDRKVGISKIEILPMQNAAAAYRPGWAFIQVNSDIDWTYEELLAAVGHECVHGIFDQSDLSGYRVSLQHQIIEESTAEILGVHLAGQVLTAKGRDGVTFTKNHVAKYRALCTRDSPGSAGRRYLQYLTRHGISNIDPQLVRLIMNHYGNERLVDEIDVMCKETHDPWEVARRVSDRYKLYLKWNPAVVPKS